jgi:hypothetical protein
LSIDATGDCDMGEMERFRFVACLRGDFRAPCSEIAKAAGEDEGEDVVMGSEGIRPTLR